jgi:hypothetical protein
MLATFGLDRLEADLGDRSVTTTDLDPLLEHAKADSARKPLTLLDTNPHDPLPLQETHPCTTASSESTSGLPARVYVHHRPNPQFQPTRQADRV